MKLFQKLLLAPAALGLFAPVVANANESNFRDVTSYSQDQVEVSLDSFKPNDSIEITPAIFGASDAVSVANTDDDIFGAVLATTFKF